MFKMFKSEGEGPRMAGSDGLRKLLLPWLIEHLNKRTFAGAEWSDKDKGFFKLPWKHGKNKGFSEEKDGEIFKEWAVNTGRYRDNEPAQYKVWKATLRNALHKHPHIQENKTLSSNGQFRMYQITVDINLVYDTVAIKKVKIPTDTKPVIKRYDDPAPSLKVENQTFSPYPNLSPPSNDPESFMKKFDDHLLDQSPLLSPFSTVSVVSGLADSEYPSELEMSPGSSVSASVDVCSYVATNNKCHIRSASGTVLSDIDEVLKEVTLDVGNSYDQMNKHSRNESSTSTILADIDPIDLDDVLGESMMTDTYQSDDLLYYTNAGDSIVQQMDTQLSIQNHLDQMCSPQMSSQLPDPQLSPEQQQTLNAQLSARQRISSGHQSPPPIDNRYQTTLANLTQQVFGDQESKPQRLGKRPRIESTSEGQEEDMPLARNNYIIQLRALGLPKKQSPNSMAITIYYRTTGVAAYGISNPQGARLYYCPNQQRVQVTDEMTTNELYGPKDATQICMPWCRESTTTQTLLGTLPRGLLLQEEEGDVWATRLCQCAVFYGDKRGVLTKLERGIRVKIFDFRSRFLPLYFQHLRANKGSHKTLLDPLPDADVMLSFGQRWDDRSPIEKKLIWAKVIHMKARQLIIDFTAMFPPPPPISNEDCIQFSESDPYDRLADAFSLAL